MTVTYIKHKTNLGNVKVPKLHRVVYAQTVDQVQAMYQRSYKDHLVDAWLEENCQHLYYRSPGYLREKFIEFECDEDAAMFVLSCV